MHAFTVHPQKKPPVPEKPRRRWKRWAAAALLLLGVAGVVWAARPDPHLRRAKELQKELFSPEAKNMTAEQRKTLFTEYRGQVKQLSAEQKRVLSAPMREKQKAELDRYLTLSPREKAKYLDEKIDKEEKRRKELEQKKAAGQAGKAGAPGGTRPPGGGPVAFAGGKAGGPGGPGGPRPRTQEQIDHRRKEMLDHTSPEERAKRDVFRKEMNDRRKQRGLPVRA